MRAFGKLALGVGLVTLFSDPMVDVLSAVGTRTGIPVFYISFILSPLVSNASELISSIQFAGERPRCGASCVSCIQFSLRVSGPVCRGTETAPPWTAIVCAGKKTAKSITLTYSQLLGEWRRHDVQ